MFKLAKTFNGKIDPTGYWLSEKLDGIRALWNGKTFVSRLGNVFHHSEFFVKEFPNEKELNGIMLDGELYLGPGKFTETCSIVKSKNSGKRWNQVRFHVFDLIPTDSSLLIEERFQWLEKNLHSPYLNIVKQQKCKGNAHLEQELSRVIKNGGEGLMLAKPNSVYIGKRSNDLLKVKMWKDDEAIVIGYLKGKNKYEDAVGALLCKTLNGVEIKLGSGLTDELRKNPPPIGTLVTFKYFEMSSAGIPRFPSLLRIAYDKIV